MKMKKFYGNHHKRPCFGMPEVPLTNSCVDEFAHQREAPKSQEYENDVEASLKAMNEQMAAVKGLSLWYTNHLTAMRALQTCKDFKAKVPKVDGGGAGDAIKLKRQPLGPHIDLQNYLTSLKSRQKELRSFGNIGKVWEQYFEKAIPGWNELKQIRKIDSGLLEKIPMKSKPGKKSKRGSKALKKANNSDFSSKSQSQYSTQKLAQRFLRRAAKTKKKPADLTINAPMVLDYLKSAAVKSEQLGNINNEILFNQVYGKYLSKDENNESSKLKKVKPKQNKPNSSEKIILKKSMEEIIDFNINSGDSLKIDKNKSASKESLKQVDSSTIKKQKALETLISDFDISGKKENLKNGKLMTSKSKRSLGVKSSKRRSSNSVHKISKAAAKSVIRKHTSNKLLTAPSRWHLSTQVSQKKLQTKHNKANTLLKSASKTTDHHKKHKSKRRVEYSFIEVTPSKRTSSVSRHSRKPSKASEKSQVSLQDIFTPEEEKFKRFKAEKGTPAKKLQAVDKEALRHRLIDIVNSVWTSDNNLLGKQYSSAPGTSGYKLSRNSISEVVE